MINILHTFYFYTKYTYHLLHKEDTHIYLRKYQKQLQMRILHTFLNFHHNQYNLGLS